MSLLSLPTAIAVACSISGAAGVPAGEVDPEAPLVPESQHPQVAKHVADFLDRVHYSDLEMSDEISNRWLENFLDALDYNHRIFLASDVEGFRSRYGTELDDAVTNKEALEPAFEIYNLFRKRLAERADAALALLKAAEFDLSDEESWSSDRHEGPWPATADDAADVWRRLLEEELIRRELRGKARQDRNAEDVYDRTEELAHLAERYERIRKSALDANANDVMEAYLGALTTAFDPHSYWFSPPDHDNFEIEMSKSLEGIGARLQPKGGYTTVIELITGGPAKRGGELRPKDRIIGVAQGKNGKYVDVIDERIDEVVKLIRGPKGTLVRLLVIRADATDDSMTEEVRIVRDEVILEDSRAEARVQTMMDPSGKSVRIGIIEVPSFYQGMTRKSRGEEYQSTTRDVRALLAGPELKDIDALVLDLRENGGGSLDESITLTGLFVGDGPVVQVKGFDGVEVLADPAGTVAYDGPLLVATSPLSASASEILAGAIQDYGRGLIVGSEQTHGKGTVQAVIDLDSYMSSGFGLFEQRGRGGALKVTTQMFFRVSGESTQHRGVRADIVLPSEWDGLDVFESDLDFALPFEDIEPANFERTTAYTTDLAPLRVASATRVAEESVFQWWKEDQAQRHAEEDDPVSLVYDVRHAELEERRAKLASRGEDPDEMLDEDEDEESLEVSDESDDEIDDPLLDEILEIAEDYVTQLRTVSGALVSE